MELFVIPTEIRIFAPSYRDNDLIYIPMANHKSSKKAIRSSAKKRLLNRYQHVTTRNMVKKLRTTTDHAMAVELFKTVSSALDKLAKRNIIHKNKASNNKSKLARLVNSLKVATA
ncbi:hypothetical protein GCM10028810_47450 [Spirosoma litoris]